MIIFPAMKSILDNIRINAHRAGNDPEGRLRHVVCRELGVPPSALKRLTVLSRSIDSCRADPMLVYKLLIEADDEHAARLIPATPEDLAALAPAGLELPSSKLQNPLMQC